MSFENLKETWTQLGEIDPLGAILTNPEAKAGSWDLESFFASGEVEIADLLEEIADLDFPLTYGTALDFGCGVGRLTRALSRHFTEAHGVDIAPSMIALANQLKENASSIHYHLNQQEDLSLFADSSFDFIYSRIVLQHMHPTYSRGYIAEFIRLIRPGGLIAFQLPSGPAGRPESELRSRSQLAPSARFGAHLSVAESFLRLAPGESHTLAVVVRNESRHDWLSREDSSGRVQINLGNHWLNVDGSLRQLDDGRAPLPQTLAPGAAVTLSLTVTGPEKPGQYWLELDMVQEGRCWFQEKGSETVRIPVQVSAPGGHVAALWARLRGAIWTLVGPVWRRAGGGPQSGLQFEMHGIPVDEVTEWIESHGGEVVAIRPDGSAGHGWASYFYYVTR